MAYNDGTHHGAVLGFIGYCTSAILGVVTITTLSEALLLGAISAIGGFLGKMLINKLVLIFKKK